MMKTKHLVVLPVCEFDEDSLVRNLELIKLMGDSLPPAMIVVAPDCKPKNMDAILRAASIFPSVEVFEISDGCGNRKWPRPQNHMFKRVCQNILWNMKCDSFYYMEPDVTPLRPNAIRDLFELYDTLNKPMLGLQCKVRTSDNKYDVSYINGSAIYPYNILRLSPPIVTAEISSWDVLSRDYFIGLTASGHTLMEHTYRSERFALVGDTLDYVSMVDGSRKSVTLGNLAVLHGCKDSSLADIVRKKYTPVVQPPKDIPKTFEIAKPVEAEIVSPIPSDIDEVVALLLAKESRPPKRRIRRSIRATTN